VKEKDITCFQDADDYMIRSIWSLSDEYDQDLKQSVMANLLHGIGRSLEGEKVYPHAVEISNG